MHMAERLTLSFSSCQDGESLVIFYGENSFGWVREDQVLDFKLAYAEKAREPVRNKARFNSALNEALRDIEQRDDGFVPPVIAQRGKSGGRGHGHGRGDGDKTPKSVAQTPASSGGDGGASARAASAARSSRIFLHAFRWPRSRQSMRWQAVEQYCVVPQGQFSFAFAEQIVHSRRSLSCLAWACLLRTDSS